MRAIFLFLLLLVVGVPVKAQTSVTQGAVADSDTLVVLERFAEFWGDATSEVVKDFQKGTIRLRYDGNDQWTVLYNIWSTPMPRLIFELSH